MKNKFLEYYHSNEQYKREIQQRLNNEQKKYWSKQENRERQSQRVKEFFKNHTEVKHQLSLQAKEEWKKPELLAWRSNKTKEQWTPEFRVKRKDAYNKTYYENTIRLLRELYEKQTVIKAEEVRRIAQTEGQ